MQTLEWPLTDIYCNFSHENLFCSLQVLMDVCMTMKVIEGHFSEGADFVAKSGAKGITCEYVSQEDIQRDVHKILVTYIASLS